VRIRFLLPFATAAVAALSMGLATPGFAFSTGRAVGGTRPAPASRGGRSSAQTKPSGTFAGYSFQGRRTGTFKISAHITVPKIKCTSKTERVIDPSVGVLHGSSFSSAGVFVGCHKGKPQYFFTFVLNGKVHKYPTLAVRPGDTVALHLFQSATSTVVWATDKSRKGDKKTLVGAGHAAGIAPWIGDTAWDSPRGELGVPNFGKLHFAKAKLNGMPFGAAGGSALGRYNRVKGTTIQIRAGKLIGGRSFTTTFEHS
jgi:hypothetical protein